MEKIVLCNQYFLVSPQSQDVSIVAVSVWEVVGLISLWKSDCSSADKHHRQQKKTFC